MTLTHVSHISDAALEAELQRCVQSAREATSRLVCLLAEVEARRLHLAAGCPSLFAYCTDVLHLSEHEAYNRIEAARVGRVFPLALELLHDGAVNLTTVRLLGPHLTEANHRELLAAAAGLKKRDVEELLARRFPRPDVAAGIRRLPAARTASGSNLAATSTSFLSGTANTDGVPARAAEEPLASGPVAAPTRAAPTSLAPLSEDRFALKCTVGAATRQLLREAQDLLRHSIPDGNVAEVIDRALKVLVDQLKRKKTAATDRPVKARPLAAGSRHVAAEARRAAWSAQDGRCGFVGRDGRRCTARGFIEFHHVRPWGAGGEGTPGNIELRCRAHNEYESRLYYLPIRELAAGRAP